eukprot:2924591-Pleurochrysis_carterae.AAC.3
MVLDKNEQLLETCRLRANEWTSDVGMNEPAGVRSLVKDGVASVSCRVGLGACGTPFKTGLGDAAMVERPR